MLPASRTELPPPSPEFSQAATLKSFRAGKLGGLTLRSEGKHIKPSQTFSLTLDVEEPSVLAVRWTSVTDGPLHFSAAIAGADGQAGADLAPQEPRAMYRSGALDVGVGTCTFSWENRSPLFERAVSYCVMLCPNRELCDEQRLQAEASAREQHTALCAAIVERAVEAAAKAGRLRLEAAAEQEAAGEARATGMGQQSQAAEVHDEIERLLVLVDELRDTAKQLLGAAAEKLSAAEEHEARAEALRVTAAELLVASAAEATGPDGINGAVEFDVEGLAAQRANHRSVHGRSLQMD